jgi:hypothetical protein
VRAAKLLLSFWEVPVSNTGGDSSDPCSTQFSEIELDGLLRRSRYYTEAYFAVKFFRFYTLVKFDVHMLES